MCLGLSVKWKEEETEDMLINNGLTPVKSEVIRDVRKVSRADTGHSEIRSLREHEKRRRRTKAQISDGELGLFKFRCGLNQHLLHPFNCLHT